MGRLRRKQPLFTPTPTPATASYFYPPHTSAVGKAPQGHTDKINLLKDQIVPVDRKKKKKGRGNRGGEIKVKLKAEQRGWGCDGRKDSTWVWGQKERSRLDVTHERGEVMARWEAIKTITSTQCKHVPVTSLRICIEERAETRITHLIGTWFIIMSAQY